MPAGGLEIYMIRPKSCFSWKNQGSDKLWAKKQTENQLFFAPKGGPERRIPIRFGFLLMWEQQRPTELIGLILNETYSFHSYPAGKLVVSKSKQFPVDSNIFKIFQKY